MNKRTEKKREIAYLCPDCGALVRGVAGRFALAAKMLRLKCPCGKSAMDVTLTDDSKVRLAVPCILCNSSHTTVMSQSIFFEKDVFSCDCPYAGMSIGFVGEEDKIDEAAKKASDAIEKTVKGFGVEDVQDLQPKEVDNDEILPDATLFDLVNFVVKDLEDEGQIDCPCHRGTYELRFTDEGIQCYCPDCGATYLFDVSSPAASEEYLHVDRIDLK